MFEKPIDEAVQEAKIEETPNQKLKDFKNDLVKLFNKYNLIIGTCGCCPPFIEEGIGDDKDHSEFVGDMVVQYLGVKDYDCKYRE